MKHTHFSKKLRWIVISLTITFLTFLISLRLYDYYSDEKEWRRLAAQQPNSPALFQSSMLQKLPEPVRRFFRCMIEQNTPLYTVAEIDMYGEFSLGTKEAPEYRPMVARQILASPHGFVWSVQMPGVIACNRSKADYLILG